MDPKDAGRTCEIVVVIVGLAALVGLFVVGVVPGRLHFLGFSGDRCGSSSRRGERIPGTSAQPLPTTALLTEHAGSGHREGSDADRNEEELSEEGGNRGASDSSRPSTSSPDGSERDEYWDADHHEDVGDEAGDRARVPIRRDEGGSDHCSHVDRQAGGDERECSPTPPAQILKRLIENGHSFIMPMPSFRGHPSRPWP